jgi:hypothetical protein
VTTTTVPVCIAPGGIPCDDGDPCTDDTCVAGICDNAPKLGLDAVTCTCERIQPTVCASESIPRGVTRNATRACRLFSAAVDSTPKRQRRRLKQGAKALRRAAAIAVRAQVRGLSPECAAALTNQFEDATERATIAASQI